MKEEKYSYTAEGSAAMRAAGTYERDEKLRNPDYMAGRLISLWMKLVLSTGFIRWLALARFGKTLPGLYEAHLSRSHHYDKIVKYELENGIEQYVILGAGLDSRPYRLAEQARGVKIFEVDHPATSKFKRTRLQKAGINTDHVTYVEVNFERETTRDRLLASGFSIDKRTFLTWEGVIMYLNETSVTDVLKFVSSLPSGSSIAFDHFFEDIITNPDKYSEAKIHLDYCAKVQEPYTFGINPEDMVKFVSNCGLELVSNYVPEEINSKYLAGHHRGVNEWYGFAHARVP